MECDICFHKYDEEERKPRTLLCGHTLCDVCVNEGLRSGRLMCSSSSASNVKPTPTPSSPQAVLEPELHAGICAEHGSYRLFWCCKCHIWMCRDCTVIEHPSGTCSVIAIKEAMTKIKEEEDELMKKIEKSSNIYNNAINEYQTKLSNYLKKHDELQNVFQEMTEQQKEIIWLLNKELGRVQDVLFQGHEARQKLVAANKILTQANSVEGITAAQHECQMSRTQLESIIKNSEENVSQSDVLKVSEKLQKGQSLMLSVMKLIQIPQVDFMSSLANLIQKMTRKELPITKSDLQFMMKLTTVWGVLDDKSRGAPITVEDNCFRLFALRRTPPPADAIVLPYEVILALFETSSPKVFLEISWEGQKQGSICIQIDNMNPESKQFLQRCTGEDPNIFTNSKIMHVLNKCDNTKLNEYMCIGSINRGDNVMKLDNLQVKSHNRGSVSFVVLDNENSISQGIILFHISLIRGHASRSTFGAQALSGGGMQLFTPRMAIPKQSEKHDKKLGVVSSGLNIIEEAAKQSYKTVLEITDCGLFIN